MMGLAVPGYPPAPATGTGERPTPEMSRPFSKPARLLLRKEPGLAAQAQRGRDNFPTLVSFGRLDMKRLICVLAVLTLIAGVSALSGADKDKKESLMKKKLTHAQKVLEGITLGNFKKVSVNAEKLLAISKAAEWKADRSAKYEVYSGEFRRQADKLIDKAKDKDLDGATLAYVEMTLTCVKCHKYVRDIRMARR
jgi:hypothetical protein